MSEVTTTTQYVFVGGRKAVIVECDECGHQAWSYGWSDASVRRCCATLCETCPEGRRNFYEAHIDEPDEDDPDIEELTLDDVDDIES